MLVELQTEERQSLEGVHALIIFLIIAVFACSGVLHKPLLPFCERLSTTTVLDERKCNDSIVEQQENRNFLT